MNFFSNIGALELLVILLLALLVVGPERLPQLARDLAKALRSARRVYENLSRDLGPEFMSIQQTTEEIRTSVESIRTIPQEMVTSIVKTAGLDETITDLKGMADEISETRQTLTTVTKTITHPVDTAVGAVRHSLAATQPRRPVGAGEETTAETPGDVGSEP
ncbi:MAG: twin-arginine translocase TatA/TatE family subunit [Anaerolineae bacterium]|nr:twin-arginine translocase TatA/TatE family subunit [Anaerolineae bacterium]